MFRQLHVLILDFDIHFLYYEGRISETLYIAPARLTYNMHNRVGLYFFRAFTLQLRNY